MCDQEVERVYREFWAPIVAADGRLDIEQVKRELYDFWQAMQMVPKVYCHITGDKVSKILTNPDVVCSLADDYYSRTSAKYDDDDGQGWCGHCACQSCYEAKRAADHW